MHSQEPCLTIQRARSHAVRRSEIALADLEVPREGIFKCHAELDCRYALLRRVSSAFEVWRGQLMLDEKYLARQNGWPVRTTLRPGVELGPEVGMERWEAERAYHGLVERESYYLEYGTYLLQGNAGFCLELPGGTAAVFVAERHYPDAVEIGDPTHFAGPPVFV
jgi:hypothetical protein